jgi:acid phosphatase
MSGDQHLVDIIAHLEKSPQWAHMLVVITYDENGGFWDHVAPPKADRWGPGSRIPAFILSPDAKMGTVDHSLYDTTSILRFITRRFNLPILAGLAERDAA